MKKISKDGGEDTGNGTSDPEKIIVINNDASEKSINNETKNSQSYAYNSVFTDADSGSFTHGFIITLQFTEGGVFAVDWLGGPPIDHKIGLGKINDWYAGRYSAVVIYTNSLGV